MIHETSAVLLKKIPEEQIDVLIKLNNLAHQYDKWEADRFENIYAHQLPVVGIFHEGQMIGYTTYLICLDEIKILNIAVHPDYQRKGVATQLMQYIVEDAKNNSVRYVMLDVRANNIIAFSLYSKFGFRILCVRRNFYNYNAYLDDAYLMQLELLPESIQD